MFYYLLSPLREIFFGFNVFRYITFRAAAAAITAFILSLILGQGFIKKLITLQLKQAVRKHECAPLYDFHASKENIPTMGGVLIISVIVLSTLCWANLENRYITIAILTTLWFGIIGFIDDYLKMQKRNHRGLAGRLKILGQVIFGVILGVIIYFDPQLNTQLDVPFFKTLFIDLGVFYVFFVVLVIVGSSNAVNLTDGLDGLAIGCVAMVALTYAGFAYLTGHARLSDYLMICFIPGAGELAVFSMAIVGAGLGFLWYNSHPATIFMGDTGALSLGGAIGTVAILIKKELLLLIVGGIFVAEALSVILQVFSFKLMKKRIFLMAPLHHHFQLKGWPESKIIIRFWIVAVVLAMCSLATLKLR
ncbi:MAG: phospho-N-acetylmuramoyl-pentapeptide-transferase [Candidatus Omnitrophota bacterium]